MDPSSTSKIYDKIATQYTDQYFSDLSDAEYLDKFAKYLSPSSRVLDVGCGPGMFTKYLINRELRVEGVDISKGMVKKAQERVPEGKFEVGDMRKLKYDNATFDGLLAAYSLIHIPDKQIPKTLTELNRILVNGGYMLAIAQEGETDQVVPEPLDPKEKLFVNFFQAEDLKNKLEQSGFRVVFLETQPTKDPKSMADDIIYILVRKEAEYA